MSYDDRVQRLLKVAGDCDATILGFDLEKTMCYKTIDSSREKIRELIESLSMDDIHLSVNAGGYLTLEKGRCQSVCLYRNSLYNCYRPTDSIGRMLRVDLEDLFLETIPKVLKVFGVSYSTITRFISYSSLILTSVDDNFVSTIKETLINCKKAEDKLSLKNNDRNKYLLAVSNELYPLTQEWYKEKMVPVPGMKIGVINRKTGKTAIKTIKRCKTVDDRHVVTFNESSSSMLVDPDHINVELTWYLNDTDCNNIARVIKWKPIVDFI